MKVLIPGVRGRTAVTCVAELKPIFSFGRVSHILLVLTCGLLLL
jgi:hypothetical protein